MADNTGVAGIGQRFIDTSFSALETQKTSLIKLTGYAAGWTAIYLGKEDHRGEIAGKVSDFMGDAKNLLSAFEVPKKVGELGTSAYTFYKKPSIINGVDVVCGKLTSLMNSSSDVFDLCTKFCPVSDIAKQNVKWYNSVATLTLSSYHTLYNAKRVYHNARKEGVTSHEVLYGCIATAISASYIGVSLIHLFYRDKAKSWHYLACITSGTALSMTAFFYARLSGFVPVNK